MFYGCTSLTTAPELPATTLAEACYSGMFCDCTSLNNITCLATDISASDCLEIWVDNVASAGTMYLDSEAIVLQRRFVLPIAFRDATLMPFFYHEST